MSCLPACTPCRWCAPHVVATLHVYVRLNLRMRSPLCAAWCHPCRCVEQEEKNRKVGWKDWLTGKQARADGPLKIMQTPDGKLRCAAAMRFAVLCSHASCILLMLPFQGGVFSSRPLACAS